MSISGDTRLLDTPFLDTKIVPLNQRVPRNSLCRHYFRPRPATFKAANRPIFDTPKPQLIQGVSSQFYNLFFSHKSRIAQPLSVTISSLTTDFSKSPFSLFPPNFHPRPSC